MIGRGKEKSSSAPDGAQSWRELAGPSKRRINSPQARKRRKEKLLKLFGLLCAVLAVVSLITFGVVKFSQRESEISITPPSKPIEQILFDTNGKLPDAWLSKVVKIKPGMTLMEADIHGLKAQLESQGQVESASVERVFPNALRIQLKERVPALRLAVAMEDGRARARIVAKDGTVYDGVGYSKATLANLPYVQPYIHADGSVEPMRGIEHVSALLELARQTQPKIFKTWQVVSLSNFSGDLDMPGQVIEIRSSYVPRIIFSASRDFGMQMERLVFIYKDVKERGNPSMERIDLSLRGAAAVQFSSGRPSSY